MDFHLSIHGSSVTLDSWKSRWHLMFHSRIQKNSQPWRNWVVVSNIFYFQPYLGKIPILTNIFQMGWNHQLAKNVFFAGMFLGPQNSHWIEGGFSDSSGRTSQMAESVIFLRETFLVTRWWFQTFLFWSLLGEMIQFDLRICFKWVGSTTNQKQQRTCPVLLVFISHFQNKSLSANG